MYFTGKSDGLSALSFYLQVSRDDPPVGHTATNVSLSRPTLPFTPHPLLRANSVAASDLGF